MKYSIEDLKDLYSGLVQLGNENLPIAYAVAKNLNKVETKLKEADKDINKMRELLLAKDEKGELIKFVIDQQKSDFVYDESGKRVIATPDLKLEPGQIASTAIAEDKLEEFEKALLAIQQSEVEVDFYKITAAKAADLETKVTKGNLLKYLFKYDLIEEN